MIYTGGNGDCAMVTVIVQVLVGDANGVDTGNGIIDATRLKVIRRV